MSKRELTQCLWAIVDAMGLEMERNTKTDAVRGTHRKLLKFAEGVTMQVEFDAVSSVKGSDGWAVVAWGPGNVAMLFAGWSDRKKPEVELWIADLAKLPFKLSDCLERANVKTVAQAVALFDKQVVMRFAKISTNEWAPVNAGSMDVGGQADAGQDGGQVAEGDDPKHPAA